MRTTNATPGINPAQVRLTRVIEALAGHEIEGLRLADIAVAIGGTQPLTLRDLRSLAAAGWAEQRDDTRWRLGPKPVQIAIAFTTSTRRAQERIDEISQRYTRTPA